ncbi:MAG TPA: response regulator transcription factor [Pyrinomonadaceae bacterium]|nr:response regulator transcription factor [Pyrinomonadaceae bacterium]
MKRVLIIDDHAVVRDGVKRVFEEQTGAVFFGEASTLPEALRLAREQDWDLAVLDLSLGNHSGLEVLKNLKQIRPRLPVLILSMHSEEQYARRAIKAGASGYITKDSSRAELARAVNKVAAGGSYITSALAERLVFDLGRSSDRPPHETLSDREFEVMRLIGSGKSVTDIAALLALSDKTISTYRARLLEKMRMTTSAELIRYVIENKLVD